MVSEYVRRVGEMTKKELFKAVSKNWKEEGISLDQAIYYSIPDSDAAYDAVYAMIPKAWLKRNDEGISSFLKEYGDDYGRWAVTLWIYEKMGAVYTTL